MSPEFLRLLGVLIGIGLATGALTGLTGASGMSILISSLLLAGLETRQVIGLTFVITLVNSAIAVGPYWQHGRVDVRSGLLVAAPALVMVIVGNRGSHLIEVGYLTGVMVVCLLLLGIKFVIADRKSEPTEQAETSVSPAWDWLMLLGAVVGLVMGVMGGGGAVFIAAAFMLLFKMEPKTAIGTSILIMGLAAIPGVVFHACDGTIDFVQASAILVSSIPAAFVASRFANRISAVLVKRLLGIYLVLVSSALLVRMMLWGAR